MNLHQYLLQIQSDKTINLDRFISLLPPQHQSQWRSIFDSEKDRSNKKKHKLTITNQQVFDMLFEASLPSANRIEASERGDSHRQNTSFSFLLLFHQALFNSIDGLGNTCPDVVTMNDNSMHQNFTSKKHLLIIENQENFFRWQDFLAVLSKFCQMDELNEKDALASFDIAFGSGNNITNIKNTAFFKQYQNITCIFDYDLGGLTIFKSLNALCHNIETKEKITLTFLLPSESVILNKNFTQHYFNKAPKNSKQWQQAISLATELGFNELAQAFNESKNFMEQESYLSAPFIS